MEPLKTLLKQAMTESDFYPKTVAYQRLAMVENLSNLKQMLEEPALESNSFFGMINDILCFGMIKRELTEEEKSHLHLLFNPYSNLFTTLQKQEELAQLIEPYLAGHPILTKRDALENLSSLADQKSQTLDKIIYHFDSVRTASYQQLVNFLMGIRHKIFMYKNPYAHELFLTKIVPTMQKKMLQGESYVGLLALSDYLLSRKETLADFCSEISTLYQQSADVLASHLWGINEEALFLSYQDMVNDANYFIDQYGKSRKYVRDRCQNRN